MKNNYAELAITTLKLLATLATTPRHALVNGGRLDDLPDTGPYARSEAGKSAVDSRIILPRETSVYHFTSRAVSDDPLFGDVERNMFRQQLEKTAVFCGVQVLNYTILHNHFHLLVEVPALETRRELTSAELLLRIGHLHGQELVALLGAALADSFDDSAPVKTKTAVEHFGWSWIRRGSGKCLVAVPAEQNGSGKPRSVDGVSAREWAVAELEHYRGMMHDASMFMKLLKQRFSIWYNAQQERSGTLWAAEYNSLIVERCAESVQAVSAYMDLNAVRAGLVENPEEYPFCGLGEAVRKSGIARAGLTRVLNLPELGQPATGDSIVEAAGAKPDATAWAELAERYRSLLWGDEVLVSSENGSHERVPGKPRCYREMPTPRSGQLRLADYFWYRTGLFRDGVAFGSGDFVRRVFSNNREMFGVSGRQMAHQLMYSSGLIAGSWHSAGMAVLRLRNWGRVRSLEQRYLYER
jgi:putative transposase